jgi:protein involved in polysaccharide export with SLBB domain
MHFMKMKSDSIIKWSDQCWRRPAGQPAWQNYLSLVLFLSLSWVGCLLLAGCHSSDDAYDAAMASSAADYQAGTPDYSTNYLQQGDVVSITFRYSTNFNTLQRIGLDGTLNLDVAGQVKAVGKTVLQLQGELTTLYQSEAKGDPITIKVVNPEAVVYVVGEVTRPGKIPIERPLTALEAIMEAGGYDPLQANLAGVSVLRVEKGRQRTYAINVKRVIDGKDDTVFYLKPFDIVRVPAKAFNY